MAQHDANGLNGNGDSDQTQPGNRQLIKPRLSLRVCRNGAEKDADSSFVASTNPASNINTEVVLFCDDQTKGSKNQIEDGLENQSDDSFTIKKGVLWQQQNYDKFHQRLFSRWKKRFFILTTDYLVCFKRSRAKVGRSEMGKFHYKTSLGDVAKVDWFRPNKSDKGAIILNIKGQYNLHLWSKKNLEEWMLAIKESVECVRLKRSGNMTQPEIVGDIKQKQQSAVLRETNNELLLHENCQATRATNSIQGTNERNSLADGARTTRSLEKSGRSNNDDCGNPSIASTHNTSESTSKAGTTQSTSELKISRSRHKSLSKRSISATKNSEQALSNQERVDSFGTSTTNRDEPSLEVGLDQRLASDASVDQAYACDVPPTQNPMINDNVPRVAKTGLSAAEGAYPKLARSGPAGRKSLRERRRPNESASARETSKLSSLAAAGPIADKELHILSAADSANSSPISSSRASGRGAKSIEKRLDVRRESRTSDSDSRSIENYVGSVEGKNKSGSATATTTSNNSSSPADPSVSIQESSSSNRANVGSKQRSKCGENTSSHGTPARQSRSSMNIRQSCEGSWQSLSSLTQVGNAGPIDVGKRSLYAQHIMPDNDEQMSSAAVDSNRLNNLELSGNSQYMRNSINIESTVTPLRNTPFLRQHSIHSYNRRPLPSISQKQQAISFDAAPSPSRSLMQANQSTSYQQKLLQLQLLHNNCGDGEYATKLGSGAQSKQYSGDYQVYGPESTMTNHYGYYSMRSNLKSATSEFSFIRPGSSGLATLQRSNQSTNQRNQALAIETMNPNVRQSLLQQSNRSSLIMPQQQQLKDGARNFVAQSNNLTDVIFDQNNNQIANFQQSQLVSVTSKQYLVKPVTGERLHAGSSYGLVNEDLERQMQLAELAAPTRKLPLKPHKKRHNQANGATQNYLKTVEHDNKHANGSIASSILCFFKRTFSIRSKRRSKLAETCSSSMGAFDDGISIDAHHAMMPSAFSTGSKSDGRRAHEPIVPPQRMVDMIEAFTHKTLANNENIISNLNSPSYNNGKSKATTPLKDVTRTSQFRPALRDQFGSPLHKSNSISTTMGLSSFNELRSRQQYQQQALYDNETLMVAEYGAQQSPLASRHSTKVMSANLAPFFAQKLANDNNLSRLYLSPKNSSRNRNLPRPCSISGQPSMISSPIISAADRISFGRLRNSLHAANRSGGGNDSSNRERSHNNPAFESRRHQMLKASFLDPTKEVAEEISSPTSEKALDCVANSSNADESAYLDSFPRFDRFEDGDTKGRLPMSADRSRSALTQQHHAVANPARESLCMDTIYDNHPMLSCHNEMPSYSQYENQFLTDKQTISSNFNADLIHSRGRAIEIQDPLLSSQTVSPYVHHKNVCTTTDSDQIKVRHTPIKQSRSNYGANSDRSTVTDMVLSEGKPAAIVAPTTPLNNIDNYGRTSQINFHYQFDSEQHRAPPSPVILQASPMSSRRLVNSQTHYQQSPLVSRQTRVLNRGDGVQATVVDRSSGNHMSNDSGIENSRGSINIAGAPGIKLEPALAASLLRGTNIDAFESSAFERSSYSPINSSSKTFVVSTRLSKSIAQNAPSGAHVEDD